MKPLCVYHGGCDDGVGAATVLYLLHRDDIEYYGGTDRDSFPHDLDISGRDIITLDFSYKRHVIEKMLPMIKSLTIIDHHKTAEADLIGLDIEHPDKVKLIFDMDHSGAMLTWMHYFKGSSPPPFIQYIEDRDMWWKKLPYSDEFTLGLRSYPQDMKTWEYLMKSTPPIEQTLIEEGITVHRYFRTLVEFHKKNVTLFDIAGYMVPVVNAPHYVSSEVAGELSDGYPFAAVYSIDSMGYRYSLRSRKDGIDVSEVAKKFGGGGHYQSAGFNTKEQAHK